jgi:hypothetical protein
MRDIERVFAPLRREPHWLRHVSGPVRELRELAPNEPAQGHDPYGQAERAMQLDERNGFLPRRCELDREGEYEDRDDEEQGQPVQDPDRRVENTQFGIAISPQHPATSLSSPCGAAGGKIGSHGRLFPGPFTPCRNGKVQLTR